MRPLVLRPHSMSRQKHTTHKSFTSLLRIHVFTLLHLYRKQSNEIFPPASYTALSRIRHLVAVSSYQPHSDRSAHHTPQTTDSISKPFLNILTPIPLQHKERKLLQIPINSASKQSPHPKDKASHTPKSFSHSANFHILHPSFRLHLQTRSPVLSPHSMPRQKHTTHKFFTSLLRIHVFTLFYLYKRQPNKISKLTHHSINKSLLTIPLFIEHIAFGQPPLTTPQRILFHQTRTDNPYPPISRHSHKKHLIDIPELLICLKVPRRHILASNASISPYLK